MKAKGGGLEAKRQVVIEGFDKKGLGKRLAEELERGMLSVACPQGEALKEGTEQYKANTHDLHFILNRSRNLLKLR